MARIRAVEAVSSVVVAISAVERNNEAVGNLRLAVRAISLALEGVVAGRLLPRTAICGSTLCSISVKKSSCHAASSSSRRSAAKRMPMRCRISTSALRLRRVQST